MSISAWDTIKRSIAMHKRLIPEKWQQFALKGNGYNRSRTGFQMD